MNPAVGSFEIEVRRGPIVESEHTIHAVTSDRMGRLATWGDPVRPTIPRSAIKAIQALPLITTGAADAFGVSREELALACASHSAEPAHVEAVAAWLDRIGLSEDDLECGPDQPIDEAALRRYLAAGGQPAPNLNCCSGKHAGFLTVTRHLGHPSAGYIESSAPAQRLVTAATEELTGLDLSAAPFGIDGCGIPAYGMALERMAYAMARLVDPVELDDEVAAAAERIVDAAGLGFWVAGTGRIEVWVGEAATEPLVIKTGADGVFMAALPDRGIGVALRSARLSR